jgi:hypothetical protein
MQISNHSGDRNHHQKGNKVLSVTFRHRHKGTALTVAAGPHQSDVHQSDVKDKGWPLSLHGRASWMNSVNSGLRHDDRPPHTVPPVLRATQPPVR